MRPLGGYNVNITHNADNEKSHNDVTVKGLHSDNTREEVDENSEEYDDYEYDDDYGVILKEEDRFVKEKGYTPTTQSTTVFRTTLSPPTTTNKPEDHTKIIFDNFILPKANEQESHDEKNGSEEEIEYEYEYEDELEPEEVKTTEKPTTKSYENLEVTTFRDPNRILSEAVVSVVTSKTVVNGSLPQSEEDVQEFVEETTTEAENYPPTKATSIKSTTDSNYVVIASVQTSRSVSGAHFLPFPHVEQRETIQSRAELTNKKSQKELDSVTDEPEARTTQISEAENVSAEVQDEDFLHSGELTTSVSYVNEDAPTTVPTTIRNVPLPSTESIIDKLDGIQSDLSLGVLSGEFPVLKDNSSKKAKSNSSPVPSSTAETIASSTDDAPKETEVTTTVKPLVLIRKFTPKSVVTTKRPASTTLKVHIKSIVSSTAKPETTTVEEEITTTQNNSVLESSQRSDKKIAFEDDDGNDDLAGLLPPGYKLRPSFKNKKFGTTTVQPSTAKDEAGGKSRNATISRSFKSQPGSQDVSVKTKTKEKFVPPKSENDTVKKLNKLFEVSTDGVDISQFLPPDFKDKAKNESLAVIPLESDELSKFLPPGFKLDALSSTTSKPEVKAVEDDISKFLPPGYKPPIEQKEKEEKEEKGGIPDILSKIKFTEASNLLPPGFSENLPSSSAATPEESSASDESTTAKPNKVVFPTRIGKKPPRVTTNKPNMGEGPKPPKIEIKKGPPTRATTEFTGWPTKPTTPFSLEKFLEIQKNAMQIDISEILARSTTEEIFITTTTTTTTTSKFELLLRLL